MGRRGDGIETASCSRHHGVIIPQEGLPPLQTMDEMQCMWFQMEMALAFRRIGKLGDALQKLHEIDKVTYC